MTMEDERFVLVSLAEAEEKNPGCTLSLKNLLGSLANVVFFQDLESEENLLAVEGTEDFFLRWDGEEWDECEDGTYDEETRDVIMALRDGDEVDDDFDVEADEDDDDLYDNDDPDEEL